MAQDTPLKKTCVKYLNRWGFFPSMVATTKALLMKVETIQVESAFGVAFGKQQQLRLRIRIPDVPFSQNPWPAGNGAVSTQSNPF